MLKKVSVYNGVKDNVGVSVDINTVVERIKSGEKGLRENTVALNEAYRFDSDTYDREKPKLPAVTWSGTFPEGERKGESIIQHSGYIVLDIDNNIDLATVRAHLAAHPNVRFAFVSPSGTGIKPLIRVSPMPISVTEHHAAFDAVLEVFSEYVDQDPTKLPAQRDPNRLCFLAYDPNPIMNAEAEPVPWELPASLPEPVPSSAPDHSPPTVIEAMDTLKYLDASDYPRWIEVGMAVKSAGLPLSVWEDWSKSAGSYELGVCEKKWASFKGNGVSWGSVVHWSMEAQGRKPGKKDKPKGPAPYDVAEAFMAQNHYWFTHEELHQYNVNSGLYEECVPNLRRSARLQFADSVITAKVNEVENHISDMAYRSDFASDGVVFKNGLLDLETMELSPHTPDSYHLTGYPVKYTPEIEIDEKVFSEYLYELTQDWDAVVTLFQMIGSCFDDDVAELQTAFMLTGSGSNGKSTLLEIIEALVGVENICRTPFPEFGHNQFAKGNLVGKSVALDDDIDLHAPLNSAMKPLITQRVQECEQKYKQAFDFKQTCTFIGAINGQPHTLDTSNAFWRRWIILDFPMTFSKDAARKSDLMAQFTAPAMLDMIATVSLREYRKARRVGNFLIPAHSAELVETYKENTNHVITFAGECIEHSPESYELRSDVWEAYQGWAESNKVKPYNSQRFWRMMDNLNLKTKVMRVDSKTPRVVLDIQLV